MSHRYTPRAVRRRKRDTPRPRTLQALLACGLVRSTIKLALADTK